MRVLILGGGYAGLTLATQLESRLSADHEIVVVDEDGQHLVQHELHRVVRAPSIADEITLDLSAVLDRATVLTGRVGTVDTAQRTVTLEDGDELSYDVAAVCLGAGPALQVEGVREHATPLKSVDHAREIHERATTLFEVADGDAPQLVVAGAGLSGVQVAGELCALARARDRVVGEDCELTVLEQAASVAPGFGDAFQAAIHAALEERGVEIRTNARVDRVTADACQLADGESVAHDLLVWTGGITGSEALDGARPEVDARLQFADRTFAIGDAVRVVDRDGQAVPATAQAAVREARTVAKSIERLAASTGGLFDPRLERFTFENTGWVVSIGDGAVAQVGPKVVTGRAANALKTSLGVGYLGSVGALRDAVDLVHAELGIDVEEE